MATLNLGRIKPGFRGAYDASTAYVVDDIVTSGNETFICILASTGNATSNATYWTKLAAKGTDGTDVGTTITTQGDILYRDGSGLQRLGAGTSGYFLKTQGTGANPVWAEAGGTVEKVTILQDSTRVNVSDSANTALKTYTFTKSKDASTSYILVEGFFPIRGYSSDGCGIYFTCNSLASTYTEDTNDSHAFTGISTSAGANSSQTGLMVVRKVFNSDVYTGTDLGTGSHTLELGWKVRNGTSGNKPFYQINFNSSDDARFHQTASEITVVEILK